MSIELAFNSPIFLRYLVIVGGLLACAGVVLGALHLVGRNVASPLRTYRGWLVMIPIVLGTLFLGREATILGVTLLAAIGFKEFARATGLHEDWWMTGIVYLAIFALGAVSLVTDPRLGSPGWYGFFMASPVFVIALILLVPILRNHASGELQKVALTILGFIYFGWMFMHLGFLANTGNAYGYLLFLVFAVEVNDVAAYTFGRIFGRRKLRERISPNKTLAGSVGAIAVSLVLPWLLWFSFPHFSPALLVLTGLIVGIGGQLGDLVISYIKRDIGIKDMGTTIQGHGGILDRVDSMIFVAPIFFHTVRWFGGAG
ncbi:MAG: phosphatidate cytidylyltransferase [Gammaproteobacteria bacterium]|nr:phosphatidate cytidylyltransferase [Gammaproteobacteria bacterium]